MAQSRTVLILGAGVGGVVAARRLRKMLPSQDKIVIVDREVNHLFCPSLLWLMIGDRRAEQISRPIDRLSRHGITVVRGEVEKIDPESRTIVVEGKSYHGDAMIVALGAEYHAAAIPGLSESGHNLYSLNGASAIRDGWKNFRGGKVVILTAAPAYKCPAAPYEAALLVDYHLKRLGLQEQSEIVVYAAEPGPMGTAGPEVSAAVKGMIETRGIKYFPNHQIAEVDPMKKNVALHFRHGCLLRSLDLCSASPGSSSDQRSRAHKR